MAHKKHLHKSINMLKAYQPLSTWHLTVTDSDTESEDMRAEYDSLMFIKKGECSIVKSEAEAEEIARQAKAYQDYMKSLAIPEFNESFKEKYKIWLELGKAMEKFYKQPLHYLTISMLKQWDKQRIGTTNECKPIDQIFGVLQAEATVWYVDSVHRLTTSPGHLTNLWVRDINYRKFASVPKESQV